MTDDVKPTVFVVDDDPGVRKGLGLLLDSVGLNVESFASAAEFLNSYERSRPGCLVLNVRMPGMGGLQLQETLASAGVQIPIIFITGHGDVPMAVKALHAGAVDFLEKPFPDQALLDRIHQAIGRDQAAREAQTQLAAVRSRLALLTERERQVMRLVVEGKANKVIATELGLSPKTVEVHRAHMMEKMRAQSVAELVRLAMLVAPSLAQD